MRKQNRSMMVDFHVHAHTQDGDKRYWVFAMDEAAAMAQVVKNFTQPALNRFAHPFKVEERVVMAFQGKVRG